MRYSPGLPFALAGLSLTVQAGEWLGIAGRTGAGKSSLVAIMLRLVEIDSGEDAAP
jgi:ABC-type multidrug transport system fused ATPase/permease subunit